MHQTENIYLSPLSLEDSETLFQWINDRDLVIFNSNYKPIHKQSHNSWFESIIKRPDVFIFGIKRIEDNKLIGSCQLNHLNFVHRNGELQIRIAATLERGKGFGTEAVQLLLKFGFHDLNLNKIFLNVFSTNTRAIKTYLKSGFQHEGELKEQVFINGVYLDVIVMAILRKDYEKQHYCSNSPT